MHELLIFVFVPLFLCVEKLILYIVMLGDLQSSPNLGYLPYLRIFEAPIVKPN